MTVCRDYTQSDEWFFVEKCDEGAWRSRQRAIRPGGLATEIRFARSTPYRTDETENRAHRSSHYASVYFWG